MDRAFYEGKKILDIGCSPRGSLEWADMAVQRIGLDPLVHRYRQLGIDNHKMRYVKGGSDNIPYSDGYFEVVCSFNSLDHVDNIDRTIIEIKRILAPRGLFLLLTDVNHDPTLCEPVVFSWNIVDRFQPELKLIEERHYEKLPEGIYQSIQAGIGYDHGNKGRRYGVLSAKFVKKS